MGKLLVFKKVIVKKKKSKKITVKSTSENHFKRTHTRKAS